VLAADIDACIVTGCTMGEVAARCADKAPPELGDASGRNCSCPDGYSYTEATGCQSKAAPNKVLKPLLHFL